MSKIFILFIFSINLSLFGGWAEEKLQELTIEERIGQLFIVPACPRYESETLKNLLKKYHIGAIIVKQGHPLQQVPFLNELQKSSDLPLLCTGDAEWGLGMRMEETLSFPKNGILGRKENWEFIPHVGKLIGEQCRIVGIHLNFAPVVDVNNNEMNPVIGVRSFGSDPQDVAYCSALMVQGMKKGGVLTCAKHFPGHGDTNIDSHKGLPRISHPRERLERMEFIPFKTAIAGGVDAVMTGHLMVPALDPILPATLSHPIVTGLLQEEWGFKGLVITDALNMKALSENYEVGEVAVRALLAGHDLLLYGAHRYDDVHLLLTEVIPIACQAIRDAYREGKISKQALDQHVLKVLQVKEKLRLHIDRLIPLPDDLMEILNSTKVKEGIELGKNFLK